MKQLEYIVFPSEIQTIKVEDDDIYGGAHYYAVNPCLGFNNGETEYVMDEEIIIPFIKKDDDGIIIAGLQSEQLAYILLDRAKKLNARFPSAFNQKMIEGLEMFLEACENRVRDRIERNVMGELKN